jgi:hypothetical protein
MIGYPPVQSSAFAAELVIHSTGAGFVILFAGFMSRGAG